METTQIANVYQLTGLYMIQVLVYDTSSSRKRISEQTIVESFKDFHLI